MANGITIGTTYGKNAAARIEFREGKIWFTMAPAATNPNATHKYDWDNKKNFNLERFELNAMKIIMDAALKRGPDEARKICESLFGPGKANCLFTHNTSLGQALAGVELGNNNQGMYAPFFLRITFFSKATQGKEETVRVGMSRMSAMMMIKDIETFNTEFIQCQVRKEMENMKQPGQASSRNYGDGPAANNLHYADIEPPGGIAL